MVQPIGDPVPSVETPPKLTRRPLEGEGWRLRDPDPSRDAPILHPLTNGSPEREAVWTYMSYGPFPNPEAMGVWMTERAALADPMSWVVTDAADRAQGMAALMNADMGNRRMELGHIWYVPEVHGTGVNTETCYLLLRESFDHYRCRRVEWKCDSLNAPSRHAALRLGFTYEGTFRKHIIVKGRNRDTAWYAMTDDDWPWVRHVLEEWLELPDPKPSLSAAMTRARV